MKFCKNFHFSSEGSSEGMSAQIRKSSCPRKVRIRGQSSTSLWTARPAQEKPLSWVVVIFRQRGGRLAGGWSSLPYQLVEGFLHGVECGLIFYPPRFGVYKTQKRFLPLHVFLKTTTNQLFLPKFQIRYLVSTLRFFFSRPTRRGMISQGPRSLHLEGFCGSVSS